MCQSVDHSKQGIFLLPFWWEYNSSTNGVYCRVSQIGYVKWACLKICIPATPTGYSNPIFGAIFQHFGCAKCQVLLLWLDSGYATLAIVCRTFKRNPVDFVYLCDFSRMSGKINWSFSLQSNKTRSDHATRINVSHDTFILGFPYMEIF